MSQTPNPDPTGVFSKTEFDLAAAKGLNAPQAEPTQNNLPTVWDLVIQDIKDRKTLGKTRLQPRDEGDALMDSYLDGLGKCLYLRLLIFGRDGR